MNAVAANAYRSLSRNSRIRPSADVGTRMTSMELAVLIGAGALAAASVAWIPLPLRVPGHAILKAAVPLILGVAAVPKPFAGAIAGASAAATVAIFLAIGLGHVQTAAVTALVAIGPAIDLATIGLRSNRFSVYLRFAAAGFAANLLAFLVRWGTAWLGLDAMQPHRMSQIGVGAFASFALCGVVAGLLSAVVFFRNSGSPLSGE